MICSLKQALVKLMWVLGQTDDAEEAKKLLKTNIAGEFSPERFRKTKSLKEDNKMTIDYAKVGLKVGLEIHQQLNVNSKLFCSCPPELFKEEPEITFLRRLQTNPERTGTN